MVDATMCFASHTSQSEANPQRAFERRGAHSHDDTSNHSIAGAARLESDTLPTISDTLPSVSHLFVKLNLHRRKHEKIVSSRVKVGPSLKRCFRSDGGKDLLHLSILTVRATQRGNGKGPKMECGGVRDTTGADDGCGRATLALEASPLSEVVCSPLIVGKKRRER